MTSIKQRVEKLCTAHGLAADSAFVDQVIHLIAVESIRVVQGGVTRDGYDTEKYIRSMKHINDLLNHFGVDINDL